MKGVMITPTGVETPVEFDGEPTLAEMQLAVGGLIELVHVKNADDKVVHMIVNEEGLLIGLPVNIKATVHYHRGVVVPQCEASGKVYNMFDHALIVGPALLLEDELT